MKFYITKYALTKGIIEEELEEYDYQNNDDEKLLSFKEKEYYQFYYNSDFFTGMKEAKANAEQRRVKKIKSLQKQILKLQKLKF